MTDKKNLTIEEFRKAKSELRDNIRDTMIMLFDEFHEKTGVYAEGEICISHEYAEFETTDDREHIGTAIQISLATDLEYDDI